MLELEFASHRSDETPSLPELVLNRLGELVGRVDFERLREQGTRYPRVHVIINPASGANRPILGTLNTIFQATGVDWDVSVTKRQGDARRLAQEAANADVDAVLAYGGDGTVMEVATGLGNTGIPLAILPGGTTNMMAVEFGIPRDLVHAAALVCGAPSTIRRIDMGRARGQLFFGLSIGLQAEVVRGTTRESKERFGILAYLATAIRELRNPQPSRYHLTLDDERVEIEGLVCAVTTMGNVGVPGFSVSRIIDTDDGLLDVLVVRRSDLESFVPVLAGLITGSDLTDALPHWQARHIVIEAEPPQNLMLDGEVIHPTPVTVEVVPRAAHIIVPETAQT